MAVVTLPRATTPDPNFEDQLALVSTILYGSFDIFFFLLTLQAKWKNIRKQALF
jgi:hypothetical protein